MFEAQDEPGDRTPRTPVLYVPEGAEVYATREQLSAFNSLVVYGVLTIGEFPHMRMKNKGWRGLRDRIAMWKRIEA